MADLEQRVILWLRARLMNRARRRNLGLSPRRWSNAELRRVGGLFDGAVVNVSGWRDEDKEDGTYRRYFPRATSYDVTNYWGSSTANDGLEGALFLDLEAPLPEELKGRFDVVFSHTVLEHIYAASTAVANLAAMTRDVMITVVPFMQDEHYTGELYGDYWRYTPLGLKRMLSEHGLEVIYLSSNDTPWYPIYLFCVASRRPDAWRDAFPAPYDWDTRVGRDMFLYPDCVW